MRRKIACILTASMTVLFMVLRVIAEVHPDTALLSFSLPDCMIGLTLLTLVAITVLGYSKKSPVISLEQAPQPQFGWFTTLCGAMITMSVILDMFCWMAYGKTPPPNSVIINNIDLYTLIFSLLFGLITGVFFITRGFCWMAQSRVNNTVMSWLSLSPVLWMWFRLARYEISNASTIDISESFFDFAALVTASLFFLQLARVLTGIGTQPKNGLFIFSLFTTLCTTSVIPLTIYRLTKQTPIESVLFTLVDALIGLLALFVACLQAFGKPVPEVQEIAQNDEDTAHDSPAQDDDDGLAWNTPAKERAPLDPPFVLDAKLPILDDDTAQASEDVPEESAEDAPENVVQTASADIPTESHGEEPALTVDDILAELDKDIF